MSPEDEERVRSLQTDVAALKAMQGRISIPPAAYLLLWSILLSIGAGIWRLAAIDAKVESMSSTLEKHVTLPGHPGVLERLQALDDRLDRLEATPATGRNP